MTGNVSIVCYILTQLYNLSFLIFINFPLKRIL